MRGLFLSALLCAVSSICLFSCQKEIELTTTNAPQALVHTQNQLQFKNLEEFYTKLSSFNNISDADFEKWEKMQGFESSYSFYNKIMSEFSKISTQEAFDAFMNKYEGKIRVNSENELEVINYNPFYSRLLNTKNEVLIDAKLYIYHPQNLIVISDSNSEKIELAMRLAARTLAEPIQEDGICVLPYKKRTLSTRACPNPIELGSGGWCTDGDYRIKGFFEMRNNGSPRGYTGLWDDVSSTLHCFMHSQKKGFLGIWGAHRTPITWSIGWSASGTLVPIISGYAGYTGSSSSSQLTYNAIVGIFYNGIPAADCSFYWYNFSSTNSVRTYTTGLGGDCDPGNATNAYSCN